MDNSKVDRSNTEGAFLKCTRLYAEDLGVEGSRRVETSPHHMLHRLWSACVDKPGYDKTAWREIERQLKAAGIVR